MAEAENIQWGKIMTSHLLQAKNEIERVEKMINESEHGGTITKLDIFWCLKAILEWMEATEAKLLAR